MVNCNRAPKPDVAVRQVRIEAVAPVAGLPARVGVELLNAAPVAQQRHVELLIDGARQQTSPVLDVPAEGRARHDFLFAFPGGGLHRGEVRLVGEDGSKLDDSRYFALEVDSGIPVALVKARRHEIPFLDDCFYLERALAANYSEDAALRTTILAADELPTAPLSQYKVVYCVNLPALGAEAAERLRTYAAGGGNVVWICGPNVDPEAYNQMNRHAQGQLLPAPLLDTRAPAAGGGRDSWHIGFLDKSYPAFSHLVEPPSLYQSVLVYRHQRIDAGGAAGAAVLARLDDGEPLVVQRTVGAGRVLMLGTSVQVDWSNLPLRTIFLPLVVRLTFELAAVEPPRRETLAGVPLELELDDEPRPLGVEVLPPSGEAFRLKTEGRPDGAGQMFRYADTHQIGIYRLRLMDAARPRQTAFAVNIDPKELEPAPIDRRRLGELLSPAPLVFAENPEDLAGTFAQLREGKSLWEPLLGLVLAMLVLETIVANRIRPQVG